MNMLCHDNLHLGSVGTFSPTKNFADVSNGADWQFWPSINKINNDNIEVHQGINVVNDQAQSSSIQGPENGSLLLYKQKKSNYHRLTFSNLNANSIPNKLDDIRITVTDFADILVITESKLDQAFPESQ